MNGLRAKGLTSAIGGAAPTPSGNRSKPERDSTNSNSSLADGSRRGPSPNGSSTLAEIRIGPNTSPPGVAPALPAAAAAVPPHRVPRPPQETKGHPPRAATAAARGPRPRRVAVGGGRPRADRLVPLQGEGRGTSRSFGRPSKGIRQGASRFATF